MYKRTYISDKNKLKYAIESLDSLKDGVFWVDELYRIIYVNDAASDVLGYSKEELLNMKIEVGVSIARYITRQIMRENELKVANYDLLTGVWNRRSFINNAQGEIEKVNETGGDITLMILDIDYFKDVNDKYAHTFGDTVLTEFANLMKKNIRTSDELIRWGGDEFLILSPFIVLEQGYKYAEKLRRVVAEHKFPYVEDFTINIGLAQLLEGEDVENWIIRADEALYNANRNRNEIVTIE